MYGMFFANMKCCWNFITIGANVQFAVEGNVSALGRSSLQKIISGVLP